MTNMPINDLAAIRARAANAAKELIKSNGEPNLCKDEEKHRPVRASARDVPLLLEIIDAMTPLVRAAQVFVQNEDDTGALEALVETSDTMPWLTLDILGITGEEEA